MFTRKPEKPEKVATPKRHPIFYVSPYSMNESVDRDARSFLEMIEDVETLKAVLAESPKFQNLHRMKLQGELDEALEQAKGISKKLLAVQS